jgi:hypothetical protein
VADEHALLVPPDDVGALAAAAVAALGSPDASQRRAQAALARFHACFTIDRAVDGMARFYEGALSS